MDFVEVISVCYCFAFDRFCIDFEKLLLNFLLGLGFHGFKLLSEREFFKILHSGGCLVVLLTMEKQLEGSEIHGFHTMQGTDEVPFIIIIIFYFYVKR